MIKKVRTEHLRIGVYIHDLNHSIAGENVFIHETLIKSEKAIQIIHSWGIREVYIDTEKGLDVDPGRKEKTALPESKSIPGSTPLNEEIKAARRIKDEAASLMQQTMQSIRQGKSIDIDRAYKVVEKMGESLGRNTDALVLLTRMKKKDEYTLIHSISVCSLTLSFCSACNLDYETMIKMGIGALFHDIGKTLVPDRILNKPGPLDKKELAVMKKHSEYSFEILEHTRDIPAEALDIALHHHERYDGSGYPHGLQQNTIKTGPKIVSICDVFDAMTSNRCYKNGINRVMGLKQLYDSCGIHFDRQLIHPFIRFIGVYPIGSFVKIEDERVGIVIESTDNLLKPVVRLFYDDERKRTLSLEEIDLSQANLNIACYEWPSDWKNAKKEVYKKYGRELDPLFTQS